MHFEVILPKVDMDMTHGTLATWHVAEGEFVEKGAPLFDIETDKAAMEVEAPASGRLQNVSAKPGDKVPIVLSVQPAGPTAGKSLTTVTFEAEVRAATATPHTH